MKDQSRTESKRHQGSCPPAMRERLCEDKEDIRPRGYAQRQRQQEKRHQSFHWINPKSLKHSDLSRFIERDDLLTP